MLNLACRLKAQYTGMINHNQLKTNSYFCGLYIGNALPALTALGTKQMNIGKYPSLEFGSHNDLYIFELMTTVSISSGGGK